MGVRSLSTSTLNNNQRRYGRISAAFFDRPVDIEYVVIAGGGGGGGTPNADNAGAGGAGGYRSNVPGEVSGGGGSAEAPIVLTSKTTFSLTVGAGGPGGFGSQNGSNGQVSVLGSVSTVGGGAGGHGGSDRNGALGGSGGGGGRLGSGGSGTANQGFNGATGGGTAGGGGGGGAGGNAPSRPTRGPGLVSFITGTEVLRAQGGRGGITSGTSRLQPGGDNTGTGGGGGDRATGTVAGANGGSGVVIFTVRTGVPVVFSSGVSHTTTTVDDKTAYFVTAAGPSDTVTIGV